ncbi:RabGAP/TBC, partial [Aureobasidium melanogenum]
MSSSRTGTQLVSTFIAFSKSPSTMRDLVASTNAALVACRTLRSAPSKVDLLSRVGGGLPGKSASPNSINTSQTRSCAGKGMLRLKSVRYHLVPYVMASMPKSSSLALRSWSLASQSVSNSLSVVIRPEKPCS